MSEWPLNHAGIKLNSILTVEHGVLDASQIKKKVIGVSKCNAFMIKIIS